MIPLRNKNREIITHALVDDDDFERVNQFTWCLSSGGYVRSLSAGSSLHRFIMNAKKGDPLVDHRNNDPLDNRKENLRFATNSQNGQNKKKKKNTSSKYLGVCKVKKGWRCSIRSNNIKIQLNFSIEEYAAYWYDQLALKYFGIGANINGIEKPIDFIEPSKKTKKTLPEGISLTKSKKYLAMINYNKKHITIGTFETLEEAVNAYNKKKTEINLEKEQTTIKNNVEIIRNRDGIAIITATKGEDILVDDDKYYDLKQYTWHITRTYAYAIIDHVNISMHRYLLKPKEDEMVDHKNNVRLDNRMENLRISDESFNSHNRTKKENTSSKYMGVSFKKARGKYEAYICKDKIIYKLGTYENEEDAARARDKKAIELYTTGAKLNFPT